MSDNEPTQLAKVIEYLHRRGVIGENRVDDHGCELEFELPDLAYHFKWDIDKYFENYKDYFKDYGFDAKDYLISNIDELSSAMHLQAANKMNDHIFNFSGDFTLPESYIADYGYDREDPSGEYVYKPKNTKNFEQAANKPDFPEP